MLVLSRKKAETIQVGNDITITILRIKGHSVQIGIEAPTGVTILRSELLPSFAEQPTRATEARVPSEQARRRAPRQSFTSLESLHHGMGPASFHAEATKLRSSRLCPKATA